MKAWFLILFTVLFVGCAAKVLPDNGTSLSAYDAQYPTAEIHAGGKVFNGLGAIVAEKGDSLNGIALSVQGYYAGRIRVTSTQCQVDYSATYTDSQRIKVPLKGLVKDSCLFAVTISLTLPNQENSGIKVWPLYGYILMKAVHKDSEWVGLDKKLLTGGRYTWKIKSGDTKPVRVVLNGCGVTYDKEVTPVGGIVSIELKEAVAAKVGYCSLDGVMISPDFKNLYLSAAIARYKSGFNPVPIPKVSVANNKLTVQADVNVTIIALDDDYTVNNQGQFDFDPKQKHTLRCLTAKGRTLLGFYSGGNWSWKN